MVPQLSAAEVESLQDPWTLPLRDGARQFKATREMENTASAGLTFHPNFSTHQMDELRRDGQPEPRASIIARGRAIHLCESLEDHFLFFFWIPIPESRTWKWSRTFASLSDSASTLTSISPRAVNFTAFPHKVDQDLPQPAGITPEVLGDSRRDAPS